MTRDRRRRAAFGAAAELYDRARPGYPEELVEDVVRLSGLPAGGRVLEIGCGTGQATLPFARRGFRMLCLDLAPQMARLAAARCRPFPGVEVRAQAFEDWSPGAERFDLILAGNSLHWVKPAAAYAKTAAVLAPGGALAVFYNAHPPADGGFFPAANRVYRRCAPELAWPEDAWTPQGFRRFEARIAAGAERIRRTGFFAEALVRTYPWSQDYDAKRYLELLGTRPDHLALPTAARRELFAGLAALIEREFGGRVTRPYLSVLYLARRPRARAPSGGS